MQDKVLENSERTDADLQKASAYLEEKNYKVIRPFIPRVTYTTTQIADHHLEKLVVLDV